MANSCFATDCALSQAGLYPHQPDRTITKLFLWMILSLLKASEGFIGEDVGCWGRILLGRWYI